MVAKSTDKQITFFLDEQDRDQWNKLCKTTGMSSSLVLRSWVLAALKNQKIDVEVAPEPVTYSATQVVDNSKVEAEWTSKININPEQNRYYDVHYFFNTLSRKGFFPEFWDEDKVPQKVREFVNRIIPDKYKSGKLVSERGRILVNDEYITPDEILKTDSFFKNMRF